MLNLTRLSLLASLATALLAILATTQQGQAQLAQIKQGIVGRFFVSSMITIEETLECLVTGYQTYDGSCNNIFVPDQGKVNSTYKHIAPGNFSRDIFKGNLPDARAVSLQLQLANTLRMGQVDPLVTTYPEFDEAFDETNINQLFVEFGQFINHDLELNKNTDPFTQVGLEFPYGDVTNDPFLAPTSAPGGNPFNTANSTTLFATDSLGFTDAKGHLQVTNMANSYLDLSNIYGTDTKLNKALRTLKDGKLATGTWKTNAGIWNPAFAEKVIDNVLPGTDQTGIPTGVASFPPFLSNVTGVSGDPRAMENIFLATQHTIWIREHNRIASIITADPSTSQLTDEQIFQIARYKPSVDATTSVEFASAAMRYGHSNVKLINITNECNGKSSGVYNEQVLRSLPFAQTSNPNQFSFNGATFTFGSGTFNLDFDYPRLLRLAAGINGDPTDNLVASSVIGNAARTDLQVGPMLTLIPGTDLAALDIARARRNGVPSYNSIRIQYGLGDIYSTADPNNPCKITDGVDPLACWAKVSSDPAVQSGLQKLYKKVVDVDAIIGFLAEDRTKSQHLGKTLSVVMAAEFQRKRDGDRFYTPYGFWNVVSSLPVWLNEKLLKSLVADSVTYADVIARNTGLMNVPKDIFHVPAVPVQSKTCAAN
ncbi:hypothetical protein HDU76_001910 [Blyttiomyces sp. JEL0837]|nr:hypothetical protein HDU76_001910 [Blyttiomyces sp. JEL0837]